MLAAAIFHCVAHTAAGCIVAVVVLTAPITLAFHFLSPFCQHYCGFGIR
jgi:hypothetical protein